MSKPKVYNKRFDTPEGAVYIGRPSKWGNPFKLSEMNRLDVIERYREWINEPKQRQLRLDMKRELKGKDLVCWCSPQPCHGDVILEIANS